MFLVFADVCLLNGRRQTNLMRDWLGQCQINHCLDAEPHWKLHSGSPEEQDRQRINLLFLPACRTRAAVAACLQLNCSSMAHICLAMPSVLLPLRIVAYIDAHMHCRSKR